MLFVKKEVMWPCVMSFLMLGMIPLLLKGVIIEQNYRLSCRNCNFKDNFTSKLVPSLGMCSVMCTNSAICTSFVWRQGACRLFDTCPRFCNSMNVEGHGWNVYCHQGKMIVMLLDQMIRALLQPLM